MFWNQLFLFFLLVFFTSLQDQGGLVNITNVELYIATNEWHVMAFETSPWIVCSIGLKTSVLLIDQPPRRCYATMKWTAWTGENEILLSHNNRTQQRLIQAGSCPGVCEGGGLYEMIEKNSHCHLEQNLPTKSSISPDITWTLFVFPCIRIHHDDVIWPESDCKE